MTRSRIQWTEEVWNPVRGCSRVSPGCDNCYAMRQAHRFSSKGGPYEGLTRLRAKDGAVDWSGVVRFVPGKLVEPLRWKRPRRVFVNSMADLFHESMSDEEIEAVFGVMASCPHHTFQVLTKRARRMREWVSKANHERCVAELCHRDVPFSSPAGRRDRLENLGAGWAWPLSNVWLGVSVEDQQRADERIPHLLATPAAVRWVSAEPLLGPLELRPYLGLHCQECGVYGEDLPLDDWCAVGSGWGDGHDANSSHPCGPMTRDPETVGIDWVVVGGESGPGARACSTEWVRRIVKQCDVADVACFVKQLGALPEFRVPVERVESAYGSHGPTELVARVPLKHSKGGDISEWPADLQVRNYPEVTA